MRKKHNKSLSAKGGGSAKFGGNAVFNPFEMFAQREKSKNFQSGKSKAIGNYNYHNERYCMQCEDEVAKRQCLMCEDNPFCTSCYVTSHIIGSKKRHFFFDITYDKSIPEGASTWSQPVLKVEDIDSRDESFAATSSSSEWERFTPHKSSEFGSSMGRHL